MSLAVADLQKQREEVRARLLANEAVRGRIAFRAYEIYQRRGDGHGGALNNWLQAEGEIVSPLVEQELQLSSASTGGKGLKGNLGESPQTTDQTREEIAITRGIGLRYSFQEQSENQTGRADQRQNRQRRDENQPNCEEASRCERQEKRAQRIGK